MLGMSMIIGEPEVTLTSFTMYTTSYTSESAACNASGGTSTYYHDGVFTFPDVGDTIYTNSNGTAIMNGAGRWWKPTTSDAIQIGTDGVMDTQGLCI